jgi:hypothetical protein
MSDRLRLSEILARGVTIEWFEAVSLVRDVAERVRETVSGQGMPELHQIELDSSGQISLLGASISDEPVRRLGQLLQAALVQADPPVQLRLAVSQATAPTPGFPSVREYSDALAYFERPDRQGVLRALYYRAASAPPADAAEQLPTLDAMAPLQRQTPKKEEKPETGPRRKQRSSIPAMVGAVIVIAAVAAYWQFAAAAPSTAQVTAIAVKASDAVGNAVVSGLSSVSDKAGYGRLAPVEGSGAVPVAAPPAAATPSVPAATVRRPGTGTEPAPVPAFRVFDLAPDVAAGLPVAALPAASVPTITDAPVDVVKSDDGIYSASDGDVLAPVGVRPQLPKALPADVDRASLGQIELLVLPDGTVGAVKLLGRPRNVLEGMLLSAAKAWRFTPATKDGRPVAYRKVVWLVLQ